MGVLPPDLMVDARTAVRVACGLFFLPHTIAKLRNIERASGFFDKAGLTVRTGDLRRAREIRDRLDKEEGDSSK